MTGLDGMIYMELTSNIGSASISITFSNGTDAALAQVDVQNKLARVVPRLPDVVQTNGVVVSNT